MDFFSIIVQPPVLIPTIGFFVTALLLGRSWVLLLPVIGWPLFFLGLNAGWWGYGVGDFWQFALILETVIGVAAVSIGLLLHRLLVARRSRRVGS
jgi:hypothetical protein